jgi:hypothetical protein
MAIHCPECGFVNPEGANYCQKCGAYVGSPADGEGGDEPTTMTYKVDETGEMQPVDIDETIERSGAALVIRAGGGRAGESFALDEDRVSIGRSPDAGVFLDDVTVWSGAAMASTSTTSARSTAPTSTGAGSSRTASPTATRSR